MNRKLIIPLIVMLFPLAACNPVAVGDSIMNSMRTEMSSLFGSNSKVNAADGRGAYNAGVNGDPGTGLQAIQNEVNNVEAGGWLIVELGSNNLSFTHDQRVWFIMQVVNIVPDNKCIAWVVPWGAFNDVPAQAWGDDLDAWLPNQPCYTVIHWEDIAPYHPEWFDDFVHPNALGRGWLTCIIGQAIGRPC